MFGNAEIKRYRLTELGNKRLLLTPIIMGLYFMALTYFKLSDSSHSYSKSLSNIFYINISMVIVLFGIWGASRISNSVTEEINDNTWDWQRLSEVSPARLTFGKFIGSAVYQHYAMLVALAIWVFFCAIGGLEWQGYHQWSEHVTFLSPFEHWILLLALQGLALGSSLMQARNFRQNVLRRSARRTLSTIVLLPIIILFIPYLTITSARKNISFLWYGLEITNLEIFTITSVLIIFAWTIFGAFRTMRTELQIRQAPWAMLAFACYLCFYFSGFLNTNFEFRSQQVNLLAERLSLSFLVLSFFVYFSVFSDTKNSVQLRRFIKSLKDRESQKALALIPSWIFPLAIVFVMALSLQLFFSLSNYFTTSKSTSYNLNLIVIEVLQRVNLNYPFLALLFFILRDTAAILSIYLATADKKIAERFSAFYFFILYLLIPIVFSLIGIDYLNGYFIPFAGVSEKNSDLNPNIILQALINLPAVYIYLKLLRKNILC